MGERTQKSKPRRWMLLRGVFRPKQPGVIEFAERSGRARMLVERRKIERAQRPPATATNDGGAA